MYEYAYTSSDYTSSSQQRQDLKDYYANIVCLLIVLCLIVSCVLKIMSRRGRRVPKHPLNVQERRARRMSTNVDLVSFSEGDYAQTDSER